MLLGWRGGVVPGIVVDKPVNIYGFTDVQGFRHDKNEGMGGVCANAK